jgi:hypothetical protein
VPIIPASSEAEAKRITSSKLVEVKLVTPCPKNKIKINRVGGVDQVVKPSMRLWVSAFRRLRQEDYNFKASQGYLVKPCLKRRKKEKKKRVCQAW